MSSEELSDLHFDSFQLVIEPDLYTRLYEILGEDACVTLIDALQLQCQEYLPTLSIDYPLHRIGFGFFKQNLAAEVVNVLNAKMGELQCANPIDEDQVAKIFSLGFDFMVTVSNCRGLSPNLKVLGVFLSTILPEITDPISIAALRVYAFDSYHKIEPLM